MIDICFMIRDGDQIRELRGSFDARATVLDALETLRAGQSDRATEGQSPAAEGQPPVPAYRHSCHHGSCGTCGVIINGLEGLMCLTRIGELAESRPRVPGGPRTEAELDAEGFVVVRLEPIRRGSLIAGIASRPTQALAGIPAELPYLLTLEPASTGAKAYTKADGKAMAKADLPGDPTRPGPKGEADLNPPTGSGHASSGSTSSGSTSSGSTSSGSASGGPPRRVRFEACIECGLCSSSCPVTVPFMGPAALAALNRQRQKQPESSDAMLALAGTTEGAAACQRHLACSRVCPQGVYPGKHIQLLKNALGVGT
jgi:succinate dehydrogenase / fumarate reductase iron-sulfur subunit